MTDLVDVRLERDELHERLGGGLPRGSVLLIEGPPGTGKSVLAERLLYGALTNGASAAFVSTELTTPAFLAQMRSLDYPVTTPLLAGSLAFVPATPLYARQRDAPDRSRRLLDAREIFRRDVVVVDTLSALVGRDVRDAPHAAGALGQDVANALWRRAAAGTTVIVTADATEAPAAALDPVRASATAYLETRLSTEGGVSRSVLLRRFARAPGAAGDVFAFRVEPKEGFVVEIRNVS